MIGQQITFGMEKQKGRGLGEVLVVRDSQGNQLSESTYQPPAHVLELFGRCMRDYQVAYALQHRPFDYFDGLSLLARTREDQRTFAAFVGAEYVTAEKAWKWKGRKNTARNKLLAIAAQMIAGILFPTVMAYDEQQNDQKSLARVMRVQIEFHLKKAKYEMQFLFSLLSALVCPAVFMQVEWVEAMQNVKVRMEDGTISMMQAVDDIISGLQLNIRPVDEIMLGDFYTFNLQRQPLIVDIKRISWDEARSRFEGKHFAKDNVTGQMIDLFGFVQPGKTRVVIATQERQVLYDIEWTEADRDFVQVLTFKYRPEDLEVCWVGGVFMGDEGVDKQELYTLNPFKHRRMTLVFDEKGDPQWGSAPIYNYAKSGFEPADPYGRFAYYKSGAFKEYWDDDSINQAYRALQDGMKLDVYKPIMISGIAKVDGQVIAPHAVSTMPADGKMTAYSLGPNLAAAMNVIQQNAADISDSTIAGILQGQLGARQSALAVNAALQNAKIMLGLFGLQVADLCMQVGDLTIDCIIENTTVGSLNTSVEGALGMKYKTYLAQSKERGKTITHKIIYTDHYYGKKMTPAQIQEREWELWEAHGGNDKDAHTYVWEINPYAACRMRYQTFIDADQMLTRSMGGDKKNNQEAFAMLTDPRVAPFIDAEAVVNDFVIDEYGGNDPDRYKKKGGAQPQDTNAMMQAIMGNMKGGENGGSGSGGDAMPSVTPNKNGGGNLPTVAPSALPTIPAK